MPFWSDIYKIFSYAHRPDPISRKSAQKIIDGVGVTQPDAIPDLRADNFWSGGGKGAIKLRDSNDFIDLSSTTSRQSRYKEYERLMYVAEIDTALTIFADECCIAGDTIVPTPFGEYSIKELSETKKPDEKFLVYSYDFSNNDYTLGWAYNPRLVRKAETIKIFLDNGETLQLTPDHEILLRNAMWIRSGELKVGDELMPFYRERATCLSGCKTNQFPRIFTHTEGWKHERQFVDEWRLGKKIDKYETFEQLNRRIKAGLNYAQIKESMKCEWATCQDILAREGFSFRELKYLYKRHEDRRRVIGVSKGGEIDVYDMSVDKHLNFATKNCIVHNCQKGDNNHVFDIICKNQSVKKEADFFFWKLLKMDRRMWGLAKRLFQMGDVFLENVIDPNDPKSGIIKINSLPPDSMYRIETTKGKLIEFQQSKEGPDYQSLSRVEVTKATDQDLAQATALRFAAEQIVHIKLGEERKTFYPYGVSLVEPARGPAHQLRLMEDAMVVYRLCLIGDTRIRTDESYKYLKDIKEGDTVFSYDSEGLTHPTKVIKFMDNGVQDVVRVRSKHVELIGTKTHPVLVVRDGITQYVDMQDLKSGKDKLILKERNWFQRHKIPRIIGEKWAKLNETARKIFRVKQYKNKSELLRQCHDFGRTKQFLYCKNKSLPFEQALRICKIFNIDEKELLIVNKGECNSERINLPEYVNEDFARLFGFICGDGHIHNNHQLSFSTSPDENINKYYQLLLQTFFGNTRFEQDKRFAKGLGKVVVDSTTACKIFTEMGYINDHDKTRIPTWVFNSSHAIRKAFVEGLSDADGCERQTKKGTWFSTIELSNKQLVEDIKELWSSIGLCSGHIKKRKRSGGHLIGGNHVAPPTISYSVTISDCLLPETENVIEVLPFGRQNVYDITVENELHNFIANGVPVHNTRAPERRVFYIDVGTLPPNRAEALMERMKDQLRKKKVFSGRSGQAAGASSVEERWHAPSADEDFWLPTRPNSNTRIETLPGAQNLGEIDDAVYFRNKLLIALNIPKNYLSPEDPTVTAKSLSSQNVTFAKFIERLQMVMADGMLELLERHLRLRGFPQDTYDDLEIIFTPPSEHREMSKQEVLSQRYQNAAALKGAQMMSDYDIYVDILKIQEEKAKQYVMRNKMQKTEDAKIQAMMANPELLGVGQPGGGENEIGGESGGPNLMLGGGEETPPPAEQPPLGGGGQPPPAPPAAGADNGGPLGKQKSPDAQPIPNPTEADIKKYDLEIKDYSLEKDEEEIDQAEIADE